PDLVSVIENGLYGAAADLGDRLLDGGQGRVRPLTLGNAVETDDGDVARHGEPASAQPVQSDERDAVGLSEQGGRRRRRGKQFLKCRMNGRLVGQRLEDRDRGRVDAPAGELVEIAFHAVAGGGEGRSGNAFGGCETEPAFLELHR